MRYRRPHGGGRKAASSAGKEWVDVGCQSPRRLRRWSKKPVEASKFDSGKEEI